MNARCGAVQSECTELGFQLTHHTHTHKHPPRTPYSVGFLCCVALCAYKTILYCIYNILYIPWYIFVYYIRLLLRTMIAHPT